MKTKIEQPQTLRDCYKRLAHINTSILLMNHLFKKFDLSERVEIKIHLSELTWEKMYIKELMLETQKFWN